MITNLITAAGEDYREARAVTFEVAREQFVALRPAYKDFTRRLKLLVTDLVNSAGLKVIKIEGRTKTPDGFVEKAERKRYSEPLIECTDLSGVRVITRYAEDVDVIGVMIRREFEVKEAGNKAVELSLKEFGYGSWHFIVGLGDERARLDEWRALAGLVAEIQVRTVSQHAWAEASHQLPTSPLAA